MNDGYLQDDIDELSEQSLDNPSLSAEDIYNILGCEELE